MSALDQNPSRRPVSPMSGLLQIAFNHQRGRRYRPPLPSARISAPVTGYASTLLALACADLLGASGGCDGGASHALCQKR